jgi:H/ACA ribonucleoprotein complex subunit 2
MISHSRGFRLIVGWFRGIFAIIVVKGVSKSFAKMGSDNEGTDDYDEKIKFVSAIAKPLANKKSTKKVHKLVKKATQAKCVKRGVKEVVKALRKGDKGFCVIAGDISPIDVISHLPMMCEDRNIPYFYVPSKHDLGNAACTKRPTSCILVNPGDDFAEKELYSKLVKEAKSEGFVSY